MLHSIALKNKNQQPLRSTFHRDTPTPIIGNIPTPSEENQIQQNEKPNDKNAQKTKDTDNKNFTPDGQKAAEPRLRSSLWDDQVLLKQKQKDSDHYQEREQNRDYDQSSYQESQSDRNTSKNTVSDEYFDCQNFGDNYEDANKSIEPKTGGQQPQTPEHETQGEQIQ